MLRHPFVPVLCLSVVLLTLCTRGPAQEHAPGKDSQKPVPATPPKQQVGTSVETADEQVYERAKATLAKLERNIRNRKAFLAGDFLGKDCVPAIGEAGCNGEGARVTQEVLDRAFADALSGLAKASQNLENEHKEMLQKKRSPLEFVRLNLGVTDAYRAYWTGDDSLWPTLMIEVLRAQVQKLDSRLVAERKELAEKSGLTSEQRDAMISKLDREQSDTKKKSFYKTASEFRKYMHLVRDDRTMIVQDLWCWQDFADQLSRSSGNPERDTYARAAASVEGARKNYYSGSMLNRGVFTLAFGYSFPTGWPNIYDWIKERPFPDIQGGPGAEYSLYTDQYMGEMKEPSLDSLRPKNCPDAHAPTLLSVVLQVEDDLRMAKRDALRGPVRETESLMAAKSRDLDELHVSLETFNKSLKEVSDSLDFQHRNKDLGLRRANLFLEGERIKRISQVKKRIEEDEKWINEHPITPGSPDVLEPHLRETYAGYLQIARNILADLTSDPPVVTPNLLGSDDVLTPYDKECKRVDDADKQINELLPREMDLYPGIHSLQDKIATAMGEMEDLRAELAKRSARQEAGAIIAVDVSVEDEHVLHGVYDPKAAESKKRLDDVMDRVDAENKLYRQALEEKNNAKKAFFVEAEAESAAARKLGGLGGAIMLNAYADAGTTVVDVVLAYRKGGVFGSLGETLKKAEDFAENYVRSGGEDVGFEDLSKKAELAVNKDTTNILNSIPTIQEMRRATSEGGEWSDEKLAGKAREMAEKKGLEVAKEKVENKCIESGVRAQLQRMFREAYANDTPAFKAERARIGGYLNSLNKPSTSKLDQLKKVMQNTQNLENNAAFTGLVKDLTKHIVQAGTKWARKTYEESLWKDYFTHDIHARVLFQYYQTYREIYYREADRYAELLQEQANLLAKCPSPRQDSFPKSLDEHFPIASVDRQITVSVKTEDFDPAKLFVEVQEVAAKFRQPDSFEGTLPAGRPKDSEILVTVGTVQPTHRSRIPNPSLPGEIAPVGPPR